MRRLTAAAMIAVVAFSLAACGRKGKPIPPEDSVYPRTYPDIAFPQRSDQGRGGTESQSR